MRILLLIIVLAFLSESCSEVSKTAPDITGIDSTRNTLYINEGQSSIVINNSGDSTKCYDIKSVQFNIVHIAPDGEWNNYIVKQSSSTITCDGQEGQQRKIVIELRPVDRPKHLAYVLQHDADEINLEHDYYQTTVYGCCDAEPIHRIYDYKGNLLLEGTARILIGAIPNNALKFFVGYMPNLADTTILGSLHLAYDADRRYKIDILSPPLPPEMCSQYAPSISLVSANRYDTLDVINDEYQLWDLEMIESIDQIRNISIRVEYLCEIYYPVDPVTIPITFGKPFGKDSSVQQVTLIRHLSEEAATE